MCPVAPKHPCSYPGCALLIDSGESRCARHCKQEHREYNRSRKDDPFYKLYSSKAWRKVRKVKLSMDPLCERCKMKGLLKPATEVHHRIAVRDGGDPFDVAGLESLCKPCHSKETAESGQRWG